MADIKPDSALFLFYDFMKSYRHEVDIKKNACVTEHLQYLESCTD